MVIKCYRDLLVWQKAMDLVIQCYGLAGQLPKNELYGLANQIQRAAVSIPSNIAEGHGRDHLGDYLHHLSIEGGSLMELETHLLIAERLQYVASEIIDKVLQDTDEVSRMLTGLKKEFKSKIFSSFAMILAPRTSDRAPVSGKSFLLIAEIT